MSLFVTTGKIPAKTKIIGQKSIDASISELNRISQENDTIKREIYEAKRRRKTKKTAVLRLNI